MSSPIITPHDFRVLLMRYDGFARDDIGEALTGTEEEPIQFAGGKYTLPDSDTWRELDLRGVEFIYCDWLAGPLMPGVQAQRSQWDCVKLMGADFSRGNFEDARFHMANLARALFVNAQLVRTRFENGSSYRGSFKGAQAVSSVWRDWHVGGIDTASEEESFTDLSGANLSYSSFTNCSFARCLLNGTNFAGSTFTNCDFGLMRESQQVNFTSTTWTAYNDQVSLPDRSCCVDGVRPQLPH